MIIGIDTKNLDTNYLHLYNVMSLSILFISYHKYSVAMITAMDLTLLQVKQLTENVFISLLTTNKTTDWLLRSLDYITEYSDMSYHIIS